MGAGMYSASCSPTRVIMEPPVRNGRQGVQQFRAAVEGTDAGGSQHLVTGEGGEVDVQGVEVHGHVRYGLAGVQHDECAVLAGQRRPGAARR